MFVLESPFLLDCSAVRTVDVFSLNQPARSLRKILLSGKVSLTSPVTLLTSAERRYELRILLNTEVQAPVAGQ